jgi:surface carbohydrate biosynthesis protein (TIGR04326 family)
VESNTEKRVTAASMRTRMLEIHNKVNQKIVDKKIFKDLTVGGFNPWWGSLWVEKSIYKTKYLKDICRHVYDEKSSNTQAGKTRRHSRLSNKNYAKREITVNDRIKNGPSKVLERRGVVRIVDLLKGFRHLILWSIRGSRISSNTFFDRDRSFLSDFDGAKYLFVTYFPNIDVLEGENGVFTSKYWGPLPSVLSEANVGVIWILITVPGLDDLGSVDIRRILRAINTRNKKYGIKQKIVLLEKFNDIYTLIGVIRAYFKIWFRFSRTRAIERCFVETGGHSLLTKVEKDLRSSCGGVVAAEGVLFNRLFKNLCRSLPPTVEKAFYLMENQGWERAFIHNIKNAKKDVEILGVIHSRVSISDLRYQRLGSLEGHLPEPDYVVSNGANATDALEKCGYDSKRIIESEALRYLYLDKRALSVGWKRQTADSKLLVITDLPAEVTYAMIGILRGLLQGHDSLRIVVKPHPLCRDSISPLVLQDERVMLSNDDLEELLRNADLVFSSGLSTSSVEVAYSGKRLIQYIPANSYEDPAVGAATGASIVGNLGEMEAVLDKVPQVINIDGYFKLDRTLPAWRKMLDIPVAS